MNKNIHSINLRFLFYSTAVQPQPFLADDDLSLVQRGLLCCIVNLVI